MRDPPPGPPTTGAPNDASVVVEMSSLETPGVPGATSRASALSLSKSAHATRAAAPSTGLAAAGGGGAVRDGEAAQPPEADEAALRGWQEPSVACAAATTACELLTWGVYLGVGIALNNFKLGGMLAAGAALLGVAVEVYRKIWERSLPRTGPKVHSALVSCTW